MKKIFALFFLFLSFSAIAKEGYSSLLKKWTRQKAVYTWDNLEANVIWHATYFSEDFRKARLDRLANLYEWSSAEANTHEREDEKEGHRQDVFFMSIYAGSSKWSEFGKDTGSWRFVLEAEGESEGRGPVEAVGLEKVVVTGTERKLFPYTDRWSEGYLLRFPKTLRPGEPFHLRMAGIPAKSELVWK